LFTRLATLLAKSRFDGRLEALRAPAIAPGRGAPMWACEPTAPFVPGFESLSHSSKFLCEVSGRPRVCPARASSAPSTAQR
jgi:hypothetical protein